MSNLNRHPVRRAAVGVLAGTLAFTGGAIAAGVSPANAVEGFAFERLAGSDRYETAAEIALDTFPDGATTAIIARGDEFADALAANYLAGVLDAPILLTDSMNMPAATEAALAELGVEDVVIVGGTTAVSSAVQAELAANYSVSRLGGADRYLTAELIAGAASDASNGAVGELNGMRTAILASGQVFADALAAGPIAYAGNHPVVLTRPGDLPSSTADVLADLDIEQVIIVGGTAAVSAGVEADAEEMVGADAIRIGGQTRYETAAMIAEAAMEMFGFDETHVNLARGDVFADALAGGPHAGEDMAPIVLTASDSLSPATEAFLQDHSDTLQDGHIFGGTAAVSQQVEDAAEEAAQGEGGPVALTATTVAQGGELTGTITGDFTSVTVSGCGFTNQTIGADDDTATAGRQFTLTVSGTQTTGECTLTFTATPAGGGAAITQTVEVTVTARESNQTFNVTPDTAVALVAVDNPDTVTTDDRQYTVTNPVAGATHTIALFQAGDLSVDANGVVTFDDADNNNLAERSAVQADITVVNGAAQAPDTTLARVMPAAGQISFTVDGEADETVVPVVFFDANNNNAIDLDANNMPVAGEMFGVGGAINYNPPAAQTGRVETDQQITEVDKSANTIITPAASYNYDDNDTFYIDRNDNDTADFGEQVTMAEFEAQLSTGDELSAGTLYNATAAFSSQFLLEDLTPVALAAPTVTARTSNSVTLTVENVTSGATVRVYGQVQTGDTDVEVTTADTVLASSAADADPNTAGFQIVVGGLTPETTYDFAVTQTVEGEESAMSPEVENVTTPAVGETVRPTITDVRVTQDAGTVGFLGAGDVIRFSFSENMSDALGAGTATFFRVSDGDSVYQIACGGQATCTLEDGDDTTVADDVLRVTINQPLTFVSGTDNGLDLTDANETITFVSGAFQDEAGNLLDLAGSADRTVNLAPETVPTVPGDTTAPAFTAATANSTANTATFTFDEEVNCGSVSAADYDVTATDNPGSTPTDTANVTIACANPVGGFDDQIVVTNIAGLDVGETVTLTANAANNVVNRAGLEQTAGNTITTPAATA